METMIAVAGAMGNLGGRIVNALLERSAHVCALPLDNDRYSNIQWTTARDVIAAR